MYDLTIKKKRSPIDQLTITDNGFYIPVLDCHPIDWARLLLNQNQTEDIRNCHQQIE